MAAINPLEARERLELVYREQFSSQIEERWALQAEQREAITTALAGLGLR